MEGGLGPTLLSPSHLSPLPVSVHTHSLNLSKTNLAPTYFFVFIFVFILLPHYKSSPNPLYRLCSANLSSPSLLPTPMFPSWRGIRESLRPVSRPNEASEWPPQTSASFTQSGSSGPPRERRDGWCGGVHFSIYPNH